MSVLFAVAAVLLSACATAQPEEVSAPGQAIPELAEPQANMGARMSMHGPDPKLGQQVNLAMTCAEVADFVGGGLPILADPPATAGTRVCYLVQSGDGTGLPDKANPEPWQAHVLYVPDGLRPTDATYLEVIGQGGIDLILEFNSPERPVPQTANPDEPAGGYAPFQVRGERAFVQRMVDRRVRAAWWEDSEGAGRPKHVVHAAGYSPEQVVEFARNMRRGLPPAERSQEEK